MTEQEIDALVKRLRCDKTGHLCGTDTITIGHPCTCQGCAAKAALETLSARCRELERESREYEGTIIHFEAAQRRLAAYEAAVEKVKARAKFFSDGYVEVQRGALAALLACKEWK